MQIIYRNQLPGKAPRETRIDGFVAALFGALAVIVGAALLVILLPVFLLGVLVFFAFILFALLAGWMYLGFRIGFRNLWEITRLVLGIGFGRLPWEERRRRIMKEWEDRGKGSPGVWSK